MMEQYEVSIHATLAGGDTGTYYLYDGINVVSIHATLAGGDTAAKAALNGRKSFLSTPPSRVATSR